MDDVQNNQILITREGLSKLKEEYDQLVNGKRPQVVKRLAIARGLGDLAENSEYTAAKQDLAFIDGRIAELENVLHEAKIVTNHSKKKVDIGCEVEVHNKGKKEIFHIVGEWEADPQHKKISHSSPLGKALLGKKVGDRVDVEAPIGKISYKILSIH